MKPETKEIKEQAKKLFVLLEKLESVWPSDKMTMLCVMIQNLAFVSEGCSGYSEEKEEQNMKAIFDALHALKEYYGKDDWMIQFIYDEVEMIRMNALHLELEKI